MKKFKLFLITLLSFVSLIYLFGCEEECAHGGLRVREAPTINTSGETYCVDCNSIDAMIELPKLSDESFYDVEVIDQDMSKCTCEVLGKKFTFYSTNFEFEELWDGQGEEIGYYTVIGYHGSNASINIPTEYCDGRNGVLPVKVIRSLSENNKIKEVNIPSTIENIEYRAFKNCSALESIVIPDTVKNLKDRVFEGCTSLKAITLPYITGDWNNFADLFGDENGDGANVPSSLKEVIITSGISLDENAFRGCQYLESIILPDNLQSIGDYAFLDCKNLKKLEIPSSVNYIGEWAFENCSQLKTIILPKSLNRIENVTFKNCTSLEKIVIPESVNYIGNSAFDNCPLVNVYFIGSKSKWNEVQIETYDNDAILNAKVYYYAEEEPNIFEFIEADQLLWHYTQEGNPELWDIKVEYTSLVANKSYLYDSSEIIISDEYWNMLAESKAQGMLEIVLDEIHLNIYNNSTSKEDYLQKVLDHNKTILSKQEIRFNDEMVTVFDDGNQSTYPLPYYELNGELICYKNNDTVAYLIDGDFIYLDLSNEFTTVIHKYKLNN